jgi:GDP/UDP-N,N'-diacetylbacillosamine 2-epimerase (hydrolysing)
MSNRKICVVTGTRAEYGLLMPLMQKINNDPDLTLHLIVTGMHLSDTFGNTIDEIISDGFHIDYEIPILENEERKLTMPESISVGILGFTAALEKLTPDLLIILGDRFEIFAAATASHLARIPIGHIHGGETTEGLFDEAFRHSISKMSQLHFVAAKEYKNRVLQLGENPDKVHIVGGLGVDLIQNLKLYSKKELEKELNLKFREKNLLITFHPVTLENNTADSQISQLLSVLGKMEETTLIFTMPNADTDGIAILQKIEEFVKNRENASVFKSLGNLRYLSLLSHVDAVLGNSSSGLTEAPSFKVGTINIGERQSGRLKAKSVIDCHPTATDISEAISKIYSDEYQNLLQFVVNPYGEAGASDKILKIVKEHSLDSILIKKFYDVIPK